MKEIYSGKLKHIRITKFVNQDQYFMMLEYDQREDLFQNTSFCEIHKDNIYHFIHCLSMEENIYKISDTSSQVLYVTGSFITTYHKGITF